AGAFCGRVAVLILLFTMAWLYGADKISFVTADLGRHIRNGELFVTTGRVITTNFYSFTHSDYPTICHHWGTGVIFYLLTLWGGFGALAVFYTVILVLTLGVSMLAVRRTAGFWPVVLMAVLALPLFGYRQEIRPEGFTTLFLAIEFFILSEWRARRLSGEWLWLIPLIQLTWINVHILFIMGFILGAIFIVDALINDEDRRRPLALGFIGAASALASLLNPSGWQGLVEPLNIFKEYGYQLAENQNVLFMIKRFPGQPIYGYFLWLGVFVVILFGLRFYKERQWRAMLVDVLVFGFFALMAFKAVIVRL
ncbi:MAG: hypothetical protein WCI27_11200, partial [Candidatus Omnitrophota bacterium]